jgi:hypothetical protein
VVAYVVFASIFAKASSVKSRVPSDKEDISESRSSEIMSPRFANAQGLPTGACPLEDHDSSDNVSLQRSPSSKTTTTNIQKDPPLTLSQRMQNSRSEQKKRVDAVITKFLDEYVDPLLKVQAIAGLSKTEYRFIPSGTKQKYLTNIMPENKNIVEGFGGSKTACHHIKSLKTKEFVKFIRLIGKEYSLEFWQQPKVMKELKHAIKSRLEAKGEKLAKTSTNSAGRTWHDRSFIDGKKLSPGHTGIALSLRPSRTLSPGVTYIALSVEIA